MDSNLVPFELDLTSSLIEAATVTLSNWFMRYMNSALSVLRGTGAATVSDLTSQEQAHVRVALDYLHVRLGTWELLAKALRAKYSTVRRVAGEHDGVSASLAFAWRGSAA
jgi:hypothetical protein